MNATVRILLGLLIGVTFGAMLPHDAMGETILALLEPIGTLWLNALRMTIIPLVLALVVSSIASTADAARGGQLALRTMGWFAALLVVGVVFAAIVTRLLLAAWPIDPQAAAALRSSVAAAELPPTPPPTEALLGIFPTNIFTSLTNGDMLPIVVFALVFGLSASRLGDSERTTLIGLFRSIGEVMMRIVGWVLLAAPVGVFALAAAVGYRTGFGAAGGALYYVILVSVVLILQLLLISYPVALLLGKVAPGQLIRALVPSQAVALSTQSSLASLPAMMSAAVGPLGVPPERAGLILPLAVSLFRITSAAGNLAVVMFIAHVNDIPLGWTQIAIGAAIGVVGSLSVVGVASSVSFFVVLVPMCLAMGVPLTILPLLLALEVIPDLWRTVGNVTADLAVCAVVGSGDEVVEDASAPPAALR